MATAEASAAGISRPSSIRTARKKPLPLAIGSPGRETQAAKDGLAASPACAVGEKEPNVAIKTR